MRLACFALALLAAVPAGAAQLKLPPVDRCASDPAFSQFRGALKRAVAKKDVVGLRSLLAPDVLVNFGGDKGWAAFAQHWELRTPQRSSVWLELDRVLALGCVPIEKARVMPALHGQFSAESEQDPFESMVVVAPGARLRKVRDGEVSVGAPLAWDVVTAVEAPGDGSQIKVRLADGREGWLDREQLRSPLDYRLVAEKRGTRWLVTAFVAGD